MYETRSKMEVNGGGGGGVCSPKSFYLTHLPAQIKLCLEL